MRKFASRIRTATGAIVATVFFAGPAVAQYVQIGDVPCEAPPRLRCPDGTCTGATIPGTNQSLTGADGPYVDQGTGLPFFVDYPCDLRPGEDVTVVLSLHGAGASGNWHRHYFPIMNYVDEFRLVVATPYSPERRWSEDYDDYLHNVTNFVVGEIGAENVRAFWLAGHSQGGMTSRRIVCTPFFRDRVDGVLSLSGGRIGGSPRVSLNRPGGPGGGGAGGAGPGPEPAPVPVVPQEVDCDFSHIYDTGEHEMVEGLASLPTTSDLAERFSCSARQRQPDVVDTRGGYTGSNAPDATPSWGRAGRPGTANIWLYPGCAGGRVVADVVRLDKGHIEGLEPNITHEIIRMMVSASGGKIQRMQ